MEPEGVVAGYPFDKGLWPQAAEAKGHHMDTLLLIVIVLLLLGGGGWGYSRWRR